jgi:hypothetical protein
MPKKVPLVSIGVARNGKTIFPEIGKPFDFTAEEIADMDNATKASGVTHYRDPLNEVADEPVAAKPAKSKKDKAADGEGDGNL